MPRCIALRVQFLVAGFKSLELLFHADFALIQFKIRLKQESRLLNPATRTALLNQEVFFFYQCVVQL